MEEKVKNSTKKVYGLSLGAILPALGFSLTWFCCLPLAFGTLGAGIAAFGTSLASLRPYLTTESESENAESISNATHHRL